MDLLAVEIVAVRNPESGLGQIFGDSDPAKYALRKCLVYDIEFRGSAQDFTAAWKRG